MPNLKRVLFGAVLVPLMMAPALAQGQSKSGDHHYQGGPKTEVPHHIGEQPKTPGKTRAKPSQKGQHHYQGGPQSIHHIGEMPKAAGDAPGTKVKKKQKKKSS